MADFLNSIKDNLSSVADPNQILNKGIDRNRTTFLKGLKTTSSGQKEDPTYTGFRIMFDMGIGGVVDQETYLPISPLFSEGTPSMVGPIAGMKGLGTDFFHLSRNQFTTFPNYTEDMNYMTAEAYLRERRSDAENGLAGPSRDAAGMINQIDVSQAKNSGISHRGDALIGFKNLLTSINEKSPWFIKSIEGLDNILKINIPRQVGAPGGYRENRSGILTFDCMDSIDLRVNAMADLYRKATYDYQYHREALPANLRKFRMWIIVTEIRQVDLQKNIADVLNPFNIPGVRNVAETIRDVAGGLGLLDGGANQSPNPAKDLQSFVDSFQKLTPYILMYQLDLCEFNFDESYPFSTLNNSSNTTPVGSKFKVHVGNVREYKLQYNILSDLLKNESIFAPILVQDSWNMDGSKIMLKNVSLNNNPDLFSKIANNFINNSIASVVQQQVSPIVTKSLLGNAYGSTISDSVRGLNSAVGDLLGGFQNMNSPFENNQPQHKGLGGPGERKYPTIKEDVYPTVPESAHQNLGSQYPAGSTGSQLGKEDIYPNNPGTDQGLPSRIYPNVKEDQYPNVGGDKSNKDLGVPDRIYSSPKSDVYPNNPGTDQGLPKRVYKTIKNDEYPTVPGVDLGNPDRIYPKDTNDVYPSNPGADQGLPSRTYPGIQENLYK
jgi:hypothetical protein